MAVYPFLSPTNATERDGKWHFYANHLENSFSRQQFLMTPICLHNHKNRSRKRRKNLRKGKANQRTSPDQNIIKFLNKLLLQIYAWPSNAETETAEETTIGTSFIIFRYTSFFFVPFVIREREKVRKGYGRCRWDLRSFVFNIQKLKGNNILP